MLCDELGVSYLARADHADAKAGNINHALAHANGNFVMLLDADMVPKPDFLEKTLVYLIFATVILKASAQTLMMFWLPSYLGSFLAYRVFVRDNRSLTLRHIYEVAMAPHLALAATVEAIFARPISFRVTPKGVNTLRTTFAFRTALPFLILLLLTVAGWTLTAARLSAGTTDGISVMINVV